MIEAIEAAKEALLLYKGEVYGEISGQPNHYGLGLQYFHLGYLYEKYADELSREPASSHFKDKKT